MSSNFRIEVAREEDLPRLAALIVPTFAFIPFEAMMEHTNDAKGIENAARHHLQAWTEHMEETGQPSAIKCLHTDPVSGEETLVGCAQWYIFSSPRSEENTLRQNYQLTGDYVTASAEQRENVKKLYQPVIAVRAKWLRGRPHAILMYLATDESWRRRGVGVACVQWGIDRCRELGIPAFLEASEEGYPVYKKLGFETVEDVRVEVDGEGGTFPAMIWWPPGTREEDKKP